MISLGAKKNGIFSWEYRRDNDRWTEDAIKIAHNVIENKNMFPICIPTYKRGKNSTTLKNLDKYSDLPVYIFGYEDDTAYPEYQAFIAKHPTWKFVPCNFTENGKPVKGLRYKRKFIVEYMLQNGTPQHFQVDDDITQFIFCWTKRWEYEAVKNGETHHKGERRRSAKTICDFLDGFKTIQLTVMCDKEKEPIGEAQLAWDIACSFRVLSGDDMNEAEMGPPPSAHALFYLNSKVLLDKNVNFDDSCDNWEDFDLFLQVHQAKIRSVGLRWITYDTPAMNPEQTVASSADVASHRWTVKTMEFYRVWGELMRPREQNGQINTKVRAISLKDWPRVYGDGDKIGVYQKYFNPEIMKFIKSNDVLGYEKYILQLEKDKKVGEYLSKYKIKEENEDEETEKDQSSKKKISNIGFKF
jgi:hypothetical protein